MEADVPNEPTPAPAASEPQPLEAATPDGAASGASDSKGWTVFMERQPIAPPPGYTGPMPSYAPTPAELATTVEQQAQPTYDPPAQATPAQPAPAQPAPAQPSMSKATVIMDRAPDIAAPSRESSGVSMPASVPAQPAIETGGPPRTQQQPATQLPVPMTPADLDRPEKSKLPLYIGAAVIGIVILILILAIAT
jgi:hypothetical protein